MTVGRGGESSRAKEWADAPGAAVYVGLLSDWLGAAQCPVTNPDDDLPPPLPTVTSSTRTGEPRMPESGYLSESSYASTYFGFVIGLPIALEGHRVMLPTHAAGPTCAASHWLPGRATLGHFSDHGVGAPQPTPRNERG